MAGNELLKLAVAGGSGSWQCVWLHPAVLELIRQKGVGPVSARRGEMEHVVIMRIDSIAAAAATAMPAGERQTGKLLRQWMLVLV